MEPMVGGQKSIQVQKQMANFRKKSEAVKNKYQFAICRTFLLFVKDFPILSIS